MAGSVDNIKVRYEADLTKLKGDLNTLEDELKVVDISSKKAMGSLENDSKKAARAVDGVNTKVNKFSDSLKTVLHNMPFAGAIHEVQNLGQSLTAVTSSVGKVSGAMNVLKIAFAATGIGALILAFTSLVAYFKSTEEGGDRLAKIMAVIEAVGQKLVQGFAVIGGALVDFGIQVTDTIVSLDKYLKVTTQVSDLANEITKNANKGRKGSIELALELAEAEDKLGESTIDVALANSKLQTIIDQNLKALRNSTDGHEEELKIIKKIDEADSERLKNNTKLVEDQIAIERIKFQLGAVNQKEQTKLFDQFVNGQITASKVLAKVDGTNKEEDVKRIGDLLVAKEDFLRQSLTLEERLKNATDLSDSKELARIEKIKSDRLKAIQDNAAAREKDLKKEGDELKDKLSEDQNIEKQKFLNGEIGKEALNKKLAELEQEFRDKEIALLKKFGKDTTEIEKQGLDAKIKQKEDAAAEKLAIDKKYQDDLNKEGELAEKEIADAEAETKAQQAQAKKEKEKQIEDNKKATVDAAFEATNMILDAVQDAQQRKTDEELLQNETRTNNELAELEKRKENGTITEEQFQKRKETILAAGKKREGEIKTKDAQNDKKLALFRIAIDTAAAIVKAAPNIPLMAIAGVLGAIQAGIVASTPIPKFAKGVTRFKGKGTNTSDSNLALLSNNESVVTAKASIENEDAITAMNRGDFRKYIEKNHVIPALQKMQREKQKEEANFGNNVVNMMKLMKDNSFYDGNMVRAIKRNSNVGLNENSLEQLGRIVSKRNLEDRRG